MSGANSSRRHRRLGIGGRESTGPRSERLSRAGFDTRHAPDIETAPLDYADFDECRAEQAREEAGRKVHDALTALHGPYLTRDPDGHSVRRLVEYSGQLRAGRKRELQRFTSQRGDGADGARFAHLGARQDVYQIGFPVRVNLPRRLPRQSVTDPARRRARYDAVRCHIVKDYRIGTDDRALPHGDTGANDDVRSQPTVVLNPDRAVDRRHPAAAETQPALLFANRQVRLESKRMSAGGDEHIRREYTVAPYSCRSVDRAAGLHGCACAQAYFAVRLNCHIRGNPYRPVRDQASRAMYPDLRACTDYRSAPETHPVGASE